MLNQEELAAVLHRVVTGLPGSAAEYLAALDSLSEAELGALVGALSDEGDASGNARALGDVLRMMRADRDLTNECYRAAFYASAEAERLARNPLFSAFLARKGGLALDKWPHYFEVYDRYLSKYRGSPIRVLEIGVYRGGGLDLLRWYLGEQATLVGLDIDPVAQEVAGARHTVVVGDQTDAAFLRSVIRDHGPFDVVIDDGGHTMDQQITTAGILIPLMTAGSIYLVEDTHTSYWEEYGGGLRRPGTFMEWAKDRLDDLNAYHWSVESPPSRFADLVNGIHVHDSVVVLDIGRPFSPFSELAGNWDFLNVSRPVASVHSHLLASLESARLEAVEARRESELNSLRLEQAHRESQELVGSLSWRITRPLRAMKHRTARGRSDSPGSRRA